MKKGLLILSVASLFSFTTINAQIKKGATLIGGNIGGSSENIENPAQGDGKSSGILAGIRLGKAVHENLIIGGLAAYGSSKMKNINSYDSKSRDYQVGIFVRKYKQIATSEFYIFATGSLTAGSATRDITYLQTSALEKLKRTSVNLGLTPGVSYGVNKWLQIEAGLNNLLSLGYSNERVTSGGGVLLNQRKRFNGNADISAQNTFQFGLALLLN
jgi:hypothetical protein